MAKTITKMTTLTIPFRYTFSKTDWHGFKKIKKLDGWEIDNAGFRSLKESVSVMGNDHEDYISIATIYRLDKNFREKKYLDRDNGEINELSLLPKANERIVLEYTGKEKGSFYLTDIRIALFYSGVAFLSLELDTSDNDEERIRDINYYLSQIKRDDTYLCFTRKQGKDITEEHKISIQEIFTIITENFDRKISVDEADKKIYHPSSFASGSGLIYGFINFKQIDSFDQIEDENLLSNITYVQKETYKVVSTDDIFYQPFANIRWGFSLNGVFCFICHSDDAGTDNFINENFINKISSQYYVLYLLRLHQKYGLRYFEQKCSNLLFTKDHLDTKMRSVIKKLRFDITNFKMFCYYDEPTNIYHINQIDERIGRAFNVENSFGRIRNYIEELDAYSKELDNVATRKKEIRGNIASIFVSAGTIIWTTILAINQGIELYSKWKNGQSFTKEALIAGLLVGFVTIMPQILNVISIGNNVKEINKDIDYLNDK